MTRPDTTLPDPATVPFGNLLDFLTRSIKSGKEYLAKIDRRLDEFPGTWTDQDDQVLADVKNKTAQLMAIRLRLDRLIELQGTGPRDDADDTFIQMMQSLYKEGGLTDDVEYS